MALTWGIDEETFEYSLPLDFYCEGLPSSSNKGSKTSSSKRAWISSIKQAIDLKKSSLEGPPSPYSKPVKFTLYFILNRSSSPRADLDNMLKHTIDATVQDLIRDDRLVCEILAKVAQTSDLEIDADTIPEIADAILSGKQGCYVRIEQGYPGAGYA